MIKRTTFLFLFLFISIIIRAESGRLLIVETTGGVKISFALSENPELTFNEQSMIVTTNEGSQQFDIFNIVQWYFENESTGIGTIRKYDKPIIDGPNNEVIIVKGLSSTSEIQIYSIDGRKQSLRDSYYDGDKFVINTSSLPKGVYIVSINNQQSIKFHKK